MTGIKMMAFVYVDRETRARQGDKSKSARQEQVTSARQERDKSNALGALGASRSRCDVYMYILGGAAPAIYSSLR